MFHVNNISEDKSKKYINSVQTAQLWMCINGAFYRFIDTVIVWIKKKTSPPPKKKPSLTTPLPPKRRLLKHRKCIITIKSNQNCSSSLLLENGY